MATGSYTCVDDWDSSHKKRKTAHILCFSNIDFGHTKRKETVLILTAEFTELYWNLKIIPPMPQDCTALSFYAAESFLYCLHRWLLLSIFPIFFCHNLFWIFWKSLLFLRDCSSFGSNYHQKIVSFYIYVSVQKWTFELYFLTPAVGSSQLLWHFSNQFGLVEKPAT